MTAPFELHQGTIPLLVSMPHPGTALTPEVAAGLSPRARRLEDTDWHIPQLYQQIAGLGASTLCAGYSRYVVDLNRPADDTPLYASATTGLFSDIFFDGEPLFIPGGQPDQHAKDQILAKIWRPYHQALNDELARLRARFGYVLLWDAHSIKSVVPRLFEGRLPDMNFGTADGASCDPSLSAALLDICANPPPGVPHYRYVLNGRFKGGYITRHYGDPQRHIHAVQLEMAQAIYMDECSFGWQAAAAGQVQQLLHALITAALAWGERRYRG
ncbi:N-formylglutamate deformylase [Shimwellia pseudoproteus]|uniref:N-formylglutamate deformylase n=1 Tax=Shimwellia pseudoproteus TaxID=570012 RepID=UPI0018EA42C3|nr:N-formylglutamate deformylase [Shimwellia pseudoproteus]